MPGSRYSTARSGAGSRYAESGQSRSSSRYSGGGETPALDGNSMAARLRNLAIDLHGESLTAGAVPTAGLSLGRGFLDLLSRPMYASAGIAEELATPEGGGIKAVPGRVASEVLSGLPFTDIKGQKHEFTQVMERAGMPELGHLSSVPPFGFAYSDTGEGLPLKRGGWADPTGRGALGFAANVALDPSTWVTSGGSTVGTFATEKGILHLSKKGIKAKDAIVSDLALTNKLLAESEDAVLREAGRRQVRQVLEERVAKAVAADPSLLEKTGVKFAGVEVLSPRVMRNLTDPVKRMIVSAPGGGRAARLAESFGDGLRRYFDKFATISKLDEDAKVGITNKIREYENAVAANSHREAQAWSQIQADEERLARRYGKGDAGIQVLGKRFADWRQGTGTPNLTAEEKDLFERVAANYDARGEVNVHNGVISGEQYDKYKGKYLHQDYKNKEVLSEEMVRQAVADGLLPQARVNKERQFDTYADAVRVSKALENEGRLARARGVNRPMYGELIPEYSISKNLWSHIEQSNRAIFQKKLFDDVAEKYGLRIDELYDPSRVYNLTEAAEVAPKDRAVIEGFLENKKTLKPLSEERQAALEAKAAGKPVDEHSGWDALTKDIRATMPTLSEEGQREFARQLTSMARDESHVLHVREAVGDLLMPNPKTQQAGDINPFFLKHGLPEGKARLVSRSGGVWGDQPVLVPQAVADLLDDANRDLLASKDFREKLPGFVKAWDKIGNAFKGITYPGYPAGAVRDAYNNLQHSFLALGVGGLTRPGLAARIRAGVDAPITIGGMTRRGSEWKTLSEELRVVDPSASSFVQTTGKTGAEKATLYAKARALRGQVDNGTRTQLWANGMRMGMTPEDAARMVHEFHYNYAELSPFERDVLRRTLPFGVFPLKTIKLYPKLALKTPGRLVNVAKPFMGRDDENQDMTTWEGEGFKLRLDKNGRDLTMLNGIDLPIRSFDMLRSGGWQKSLERLVGAAHPVPKIFYMMSSHRDPFRGREMSRMSAPAIGRLFENAPQPLKDLIGWQPPKVDAAGRKTYTVNEERVRIALEASMMSRVFSTSDAYFRDMMQEDGAPDWWLRFFTGLQLKTLNLDAERKKKWETAIRIAEEEAVKQGQMREYRKVYKEKGQ